MTREKLESICEMYDQKLAGRFQVPPEKGRWWVGHIRWYAEQHA